MSETPKAGDLCPEVGVPEGVVAINDRCVVKTSAGHVSSRPLVLLRQIRSNPWRAARQSRDVEARLAEQSHALSPRDAMSAVDSPLQDADDSRSGFEGASSLAA